MRQTTALKLIGSIRPCEWSRALVITLAAACLLLILFLAIVDSQPKSDQDWNLSVVLSSDILTVDCAQFVLPIDVGRILSEPDPANTEGEFSESLRAGFANKITIQPESGTSDTLSQISGCTHDGAEFFLSTQDVGDTINITDTGNIDPPGTIVTLDDPEDVVHIVLRGTTFKVVGSVGAGGGGGSQNLQQVLTIGRVVTDAIDVANAMRVGASNDYLEFFFDSASNVPTIKATCGGGACLETGATLAANGNFVIRDSGGSAILSIAETGQATHTHTRDIVFSAATWEMDGSICSEPSALDSSSESAVLTLSAENQIFRTVQCGTQSTSGQIYMQTALDSTISTGTTIDVFITATNIGLAPSGSIDFNISASCTSITGGFLTDNYGTAIAAEIDFAGKTQAQLATSNAGIALTITPGGSCTASSFLKLRMAMLAGAGESDTTLTDVHLLHLIARLTSSKL